LPSLAVMNPTKTLFAGAKLLMILTNPFCHVSLRIGSRSVDMQGVPNYMG